LMEAAVYLLTLKRRVLPALSLVVPREDPSARMLSRCYAAKLKLKYGRYGAMQPSVIFACWNGSWE
jgi:hypothetical protein